MGSPNSLRNANSSASELAPSSQCASSMRSASGASSACAASRLRVAAPIAKRSRAAPGSQGERTGERRGLRRGYPVQRPEGGAQELEQPREGHLRLGLDSARTQHQHPLRLLGGVVEQGSLADPSLADEREDAALPDPRIRQQAIERRPLLVAAEQHRRSV